MFYTNRENNILKKINLYEIRMFYVIKKEDIQMEKNLKTYLFVCWANMQRSPTAEEVAKGLLEANGMKIKTKSAGLSPLSEQPINKTLVNEAGLIFVMEEYMKTFITKQYGIEPGRIINLDIPDIYEKNNPRLIQILTEKLKPFIVR